MRWGARKPSDVKNTERRFKLRGEMRILNDFEHVFFHLVGCLRFNLAKYIISMK